MWFTVALQSHTLLIGDVYKPLSGNSDILEYFNTLPKITEFGAQSILLARYINVHHQDWLSSRTTFR